MRVAFAAEPESEAEARELWGVPRVINDCRFVERERRRQWRRKTAFGAARFARSVLRVLWFTTRAYIFFIFKYLCNKLMARAVHF